MQEPPLVSIGRLIHLPRRWWFPEQAVLPHPWSEEDEEGRGIGAWGGGGGWFLVWAAVPILEARKHKRRKRGRRRKRNRKRRIVSSTGSTTHPWSGEKKGRGAGGGEKSSFWSLGEVYRLISGSFGLEGIWTSKIFTVNSSRLQIV